MREIIIIFFEHYVRHIIFTKQNAEHCAPEIGAVNFDTQ